MNEYQKQYAAFMESVCNQFNCPDAIPALRKGFEALCEAQTMNEGTGYGLSFEPEKYDLVYSAMKKVNGMQPSPKIDKIQHYLSSKYDKLDQHYPENQRVNRNEECKELANKILSILQSFGDLPVDQASIDANSTNSSDWGYASIAWNGSVQDEDQPSRDRFYMYTIEIGDIYQDQANEFVVSAPAKPTEEHDTVIYHGSNIHQAAQRIHDHAVKERKERYLRWYEIHK